MVAATTFYYKVMNKVPLGGGGGGGEGQDWRNGDSGMVH